MIKGINQSMVNRSIAGGGVSCKCNGNYISGGKIEVEYTIYTIEGDNKKYITKEEASRVYNAILSVDQEKYTFYLSDRQSINEMQLMAYDTIPCITMYSHGYDKGALHHRVNIIVLNNGTSAFGIVAQTYNNVINYTASGMSGYTMIENITGTITSSIPYKYTFYYRER